MRRMSYVKMKEKGLNEAQVMESALVRQAGHMIEKAEGLKGGAWEEEGCLEGRLRTKWLGEMGSGWFWRAWLLDRPQEPRLWLGLTDVQGGQFVVSRSWVWTGAKWEPRFHKSLEDIKDWDYQRISSPQVTMALLTAVPLLLMEKVSSSEKLAEWVDRIVEREPVWLQELTIREGLRVVGVPKPMGKMKEFWARLIVGEKWRKVFMRREEE